MHYKNEIPSKNASSVKPVSLYLQTRPFAPPTTEEEEPQMRSRSTESAADFSHPSGIYPSLLNASPSQPANTSIDNPSLQRKETDAVDKATAFKDKLRAKITNPLPMPRENRAGSLLKKPIQAKLNIGEPDDKYEKEADATAERVVQQINSPLQEQSVQRQELMEEEDELQMKSLMQRRENIGGGVASTDLESSIQSARGSGQSLDPNLQAKMGEAMGADFSGVKLHTDSQSDQLNQSIQAKAFTAGQDVFFRQGAYQPSSRGGQELIAHELTHVVQQNGGAIISKDSSLEHKVDVTIQRKITDGWGEDLSDESIKKLKEMFGFRHGDGDLKTCNYLIDSFHNREDPITLQDLVIKLKSSSNKESVRVGHLISLILHQFQDWKGTVRDEISGEDAWGDFTIATLLIRTWVSQSLLLNDPGIDESLLQSQITNFEIPSKYRSRVLKIKQDQWQAAAVAARRAGWLSGIGFLELKRALKEVCMKENSHNVIELKLSRDVIHEGLYDDPKDMMKVGTVQIPGYATTKEALNKALAFFSMSSLGKSGGYDQKFGIILKELDYGHKLVDIWENYTHREKGKHVDEKVKFNFLALLSPKENSQEVIGANGQVLGDGSYMYTIDPSFRVRYMPAANYVGEGGTAKNFFQFIPHSQLASLGAVVAAGNFVIEKGQFKWIDNGSGHYRVDSSVNASNARAALTNLGYDVSHVNFLSRGAGELDETYKMGNEFLEGLPKGQERPVMTREIKALQTAMDKMH